MEALSKGKIYGKDSLVVSLQRLINTFKSHEIIPLAQSVLDFVNKGNEISMAGNSSLYQNNDASKQKKANSKKDEHQTKAENSNLNKLRLSEPKPKNTTDTIVSKPTEPKKITNSLYKLDTKANHFFILLVDASKVNVNVLKVKISDFNRKHFASNNLIITSVIYNQNTHLISVEQFANSDEAISYFKNITADIYVFSNLNNDNSANFVITTENFSTFYKIKDLEGYKNFFISAYLSN